MYIGIDICWWCCYVIFCVQYLFNCCVIANVLSRRRSTDQSILFHLRNICYEKLMNYKLHNIDHCYSPGTVMRADPGTERGREKRRRMRRKEGKRRRGEGRGRGGGRKGGEGHTVKVKVHVVHTCIHECCEYMTYCSTEGGGRRGGGRDGNMEFPASHVPTR